MYSRVMQLEIDTLSITTQEAVDLFRTRVLPDLRTQDGYEGVVVLANPDGKAEIVTFWETPEEASAAAAFGSEALERFVTVFRSPVGRDQYEVVLTELPDVVVA